MEGKVQLKWLDGPFFLFKFELLSDVEKAFHVKRRLFEGKLLLLDRWSPVADCFRREVVTKESWVRLMGLLLHIWNKGLLKKLGHACGGFTPHSTEPAVG